jgi:hypothetical protein
VTTDFAGDSTPRAGFWFTVRNGMRSRLALTTAIGATLATGVASAAMAAAQPTSPASGAATTSHPTFTWTLPPSQQADSVWVATSPATTPAGEFYQENVVDIGILSEAQQTTWAPARALFAGPHWWNVHSHDRNTFTFFRSLPSAFTVAPQTRIRRVRIQRSSFVFSPDQLDFTVRWVTNVRAVTVEARIFKGRRQVGRVRSSEETLISLSEDTEFLTWRRPRGVKTGTRLRVVVAVRGGGRAAMVQRFVRAP